MGKKRRNPRADRAIDRAIRAALWLGQRLPYERRLRFFGWAASRIIAPIAGWPDRIRDNLAHVMPDMPEDERERIVRAVPDNVGRTLAEMYSAPEFIARFSSAPVEGPGLAVIEAARDARRPAILVTAHFGNYVVARVALMGRGCDIGGLYRPMRNSYFNDHYVNAMSEIGRPMFPTGRQGLGQLIRHLRGGGMIGILTDIYAKHAPEIDFLGQPAPTALSAAELALKYDAPILPVYGIRQPDGVTFRIIAEAPIPPSDPMTMTQQLNDSLSALVRKHPEQWFWIHRRWKPERQRARAAATIRP